MYAVEGILFWFFLALCICQWSFFWRPYFTENFRDRLFRLREELFVFAMNGKIDFKDPVYKEMRRRINNLLRYAHRTNFINFATNEFFFRKHVELDEIYERRHKEWIEMLDTVEDGEAKEFISNLRDTIRTDVCRHLVLSSPIIVLMAIFIVPVFKTFEIWEKIKCFISQRIGQAIECENRTYLRT